MDNYKEQTFGECCGKCEYCVSFGHSGCCNIKKEYTDDEISEANYDPDIEPDIYGYLHENNVDLTRICDNFKMKDNHEK